MGSRVARASYGQFESCQLVLTGVFTSIAKIMQGKKVLYLLGAGMSRGIGAATTVQAGHKISIPIQAEFWETFLRFCRDKEHRETIESFLFRYFLGYRRMPTRSSASNRRKQLAIIDVEEVFTFLSERARAPSSSPQLRTYAAGIWAALVEEIGNVFCRFVANAKTRKAVREFHKRHVRSFDAVVSFNYDTVFECSLPPSVDWGYVGLESVTNKLSILKPHGSVNWALAEDRIQVLERPERSVIVAPTHLKFVEYNEEEAVATGYLNQAVEIRDIWKVMEREMKAAKVLVFIGYSFPVADLYFSSVLRTILADRKGAPDIVIVNPDAVALTGRLKARFPLARVVKYFDFQQFVDAGRRGVIRAIENAE